MTVKKAAPGTADDGGPSQYDDVSGADESIVQRNRDVEHIDVEVARRFLSQLDNGGRFGFRALGDNTSAVNRWGFFEDVTNELVRLNEQGAGIYFTVNELDGKGYKAGHITRIRAVFLDLDEGGREALDKVLKCELPPNIAIETSPDKFHCYWQVDGLPLEQFTSVQEALADRFGGDPVVKDLPRIMRLPGFLHQKSEPFSSRLIHIDSQSALYSGNSILSAFLSGDSERRPRKTAGPLPEVIPEGERETRLVSLAGTLRQKGASEEEIYAALVPINKRCQPPLPEKDLRKIALSISKKDAGDGSFIKNKEGVIIKDSQDNIRLALSRLRLAVAHDVFSDRLLIRRGDAPQSFLDDPAMDRHWLEVDDTFHFRPTQGFFRTVVTDHARSDAFHPVLDYLNSLSWDGNARLDSWLIEYGNAADREYCRTVGTLLLVAAVRRVREPGVKFDEMVVLESPQGTGKSSALTVLCPDPKWFTDDLPLNVSAKEVIERTAGKWLVEASELSGMRKGDVEHLKGFLSRQKDVARLAYGRLPTERLRHFVVVGTTNSDQYLKDSTGNRRFWPVRVTGFDLKGLAAARDQLWAEASVKEAAGASIRLDPALWPVAEAEQEQRREDDPWESLIAGVLGDLNGKILADDIWQIVGVPTDRRVQQHSSRIGGVMKKLGYTRRQLKCKGQNKYHYCRGTKEEQNKRIVLDNSLTEGLRTCYEGDSRPPQRPLPF